MCSCNACCHTSFLSVQGAVASSIRVFPYIAFVFIGRAVLDGRLLRLLLCCRWLPEHSLPVCLTYVCLYSLPVAFANSIVALAASQSGRHLSLPPSTFLPCFMWLEYLHSAYDTLQYPLSWAAFLLLLSSFHLGHENRKCGIFSITPRSHLCVSAILIFCR